MAPEFQRRPQRVLLLCVAASVALHALVLTALPALTHDAPPFNARVLDVVLRRPEPLPVTVSESRNARPPGPKVRRVRETAPNSEPVQPKRSEPQLLELPELRSIAEPVFKIAPPPAESPGPALEVQAEAAAEVRETATISPPAFNAAYLLNPPPRYPLVARRNGEQGTVTLRVLVTRDGVPQRVSVEKTSGSSHLDSAALETVKTWRFMPARHGAQPVEAWVLVPIVFKLEGVS